MSELGDALRADRRLWEKHGVIPQGERLALFLDRVKPADLDDPDLVFLWVAAAIATSKTEGDDDPAAHFAFGELTERVSSAAIAASSLLNDLDIRTPDGRRDSEFSNTFMLEDGSRVHVERSVLPDARPVLHGWTDPGNSDVTEVTLVAGGACQIRRRRASMRPR
ncbi:MAG TPA: hypothetical protein VJ850_08360 [Candidatus Limnocylindrales bacterium]|nr:hypothetical protein [Candidatus Limnocylindrales bacterium]